jgi:hypothetical protein
VTSRTLFITSKYLDTIVQLHLLRECSTVYFKLIQLNYKKSKEFSTVNCTSVSTILK